ncbi:type I polyketide synthase [Roseomonas gilardii]|uniref:Type I polyketide synthase n=1 Tax=Roseomonas gilardii TaxID=257708 RepID=A0ABU3MCJ7_9PROT|nr:type I polyketide synthase [Roseomonas gilardii]MDT8330303.1 type I polyketide synthase [Roseomonas gilardii]
MPVAKNSQKNRVKNSQRKVVPIAIVGAACRFPGAPDLESFWRLMAEGRDAVSTLPEDRFSQARFHHPRKGEPGRAYTFAAGHLGDIAGFDARAFGLSPREAAEADPQQRLLLEVAAEAIEDSGMPASSLAGRPVGVWIGGSSTDYAELRLSDPSGADRYFMTGNTLSILANRLTNVFDLRGPAQTVDTACSSALVALHHALRALAHGDAELALVGGVQLLLSPYAFMGFSRASMLSPTGRCRAFDATADGYVRAEGAGVVVLKPLDRALAEGDQVRAVLLASGVNSAGRTIGLSLPNGEAQAALMARVMREAEVEPEQFGYFEAHGTGTQAGDPIETWAIGEAIAKRRRAPLPVGSVKTNIGHTEPASGMAGLLKAMLVLERRSIPPSLHFSTPNPNIAFDRLNLHVPVAEEPLRLGGRPARRRGDPAPVVGVNSFGFGGTNASVILAAAPVTATEEPGPGEVPAPVAAPLPPLLLSARSPAALRLLAGRWQARLAETPDEDLPALLRGAARHRDLQPHRLALRGCGAAELAAALADWSEGRDSPAATEGQAPTVSDLPAGGLAFVFSGNGSQFPGMAREALAASPALRAGLEEADAALAPLLGWSPAARLAAGVSEAEVAGTDIAQPLLFAIQAALLRALAGEGLRPALVLGHSVGEAAAALAAGILDMDQAARLVVARSAAQHRTRGQGRMAALALPPEEAAPLLAEAGPGLEIAARNAPRAVTVAGPAGAIARLAELAKAQRANCVPLDLDYAFHSAAMDPVREALLGALGAMAPRHGTIPFISTVTGAPLPGEAADAEYWWRNLRAPVRFAEATAAALGQGARLFLEIGPNPVLQSYLREGARTAGLSAGTVFSLSRRDRPEAFPGGDPIPAIADRATTRGADPRGGALFQGPTRRDLPLTPFARERHWLAMTGESERLHDAPRDHRLLGERRDPEPRLWSRELDTLLEPWLADHRLGGEPVLPAAAMLEMALAAAALRFPEAPALEVATFQILRPLPLSDSEARQVRLRLADDGIVTLESRLRLAEAAWTLHARGRLGEAGEAALPDAPALALAAPDEMTGAEITALAARLGLDYGPAFRPVAALAAEDGQAVLRLALPESAPPDEGFHLHPVRLDGALQGLIGLLAPQFPVRAEALPEGETLVPVRFERLVFRRGAAPADSAELRLASLGERSAEATLLLRDAAGQVVAFAQGVTLQRLRLARGEEAPLRAFRLEDVPVADPSLPAPEPALAAALAAAMRADERLDLSESALLLEGWAGALAQRALSALPAARPLAPSAPATPLANGLWQALAEDGLAHHDGTGWRLLPQEDLPAPEEIWQSVLAEQPSLAHDLAWLALAAEHLPGSLAGHVPTLPLAPPDLAGGQDRLAEAAAAAAAALATAWPADRPLRVLDLGGAALTRHLLAALAETGRAVTLLVAGEGRPLPEARGGVTPEALAWDPLSDQPAPVAADLVAGIGAALRARCGTGLLARLAPALAEGGTLLLAEPLPGRLFDLALGQEPGWWSGRPLPDATEWRAALAPEAGWQHAQAEPLRAAPWPALLLLAARPAPCPSVAGAMPGTARPLLLADAGAAALRDALAGEFAAALPDALRDGGRLEDATALPARELRGTELLVLAAPDEAALPATLASLARLAEAAQGAVRRFTLVIAGGPAHPAAEALRAFARGLANEMPDLAPRRILLDTALEPRAAAARLLPELLAPAAEPELLIGAAARRAPRLRPGAADPRPPCAPARLAVRQPGQLGTLAWEALPPVQHHMLGQGLAQGEIAVRVEAAGLNFRDLMWAQGLLPEETLRDGFAGPGLGMEFAGVVEAVGPGTALHPGARVFGFAPRALASHAVTRAEAVAPMPEGMGFAAAATAPVAFLTALWSLEACARLQPGERVLVHGGAGAVGLAALQVARAAGAEVAMTAGTEAKRAFLRAAGADLVLDSRDAGFADHLRRHWPDGVDVVLNSLAGEAMERSIALLRPWGRFVELGKRDYAEDRRIALRPFRRNISYFGVDVDQLPAARPAEAQRLIESLRDRLSRGELLPLPRLTRRAEEVEDAFRLLQASAQIGKIVILPPRLQAAEKPDWTPPEGIVLVTGGTGGFGLECAKWLAASGAGRLALISRRGPATPGIEAALVALGALGARASAHACDAADPQALAALLGTLRREGPIAGLVHAAAVFDDGALASLDAPRFAAVLAPKLGAALNLDRLTRRDPLELFLLFSSATTPLGNPGQGNYVAANAGLEALARARRAAGRPALAVGWGPIADAGILARESGTAATLARRLGVEPMASREALDSLPALLSGDRPVVHLARLGWRRLGAALPVLREPAFAPVREAGGTGAEVGDMRAHLAALPPEEARALLVRIGAEELGRILRLPPESLAADTPVARLGLDSLGGLELRGALEQRLGLSVPLASVTDDLTLGSLAARVVDGLRGGGEEAQVAMLLEHFEPSRPPEGMGGEAAPAPASRDDVHRSPLPTASRHDSSGGPHPGASGGQPLTTEGETAR